MKRIFFPVLFAASMLMAQEFGYEHAMLTEYRAIGASYNQQKFSPRASNSLSDSDRTNFSSPLPFFEFRQNNGRLAVGFQTYRDITGATRESFSVGGESRNDFALGKESRSSASWYLPLIVGANYLRAQAPDKTLEDFDVGSFGLGTGIAFKHFSRTYGIQAFAVGMFAYASEGFSTDYGTQSSLCAEIQLVIADILYQGIVVGYRYESQQWNMSNNALDYQRHYHGAFAGLLF